MPNNNSEEERIEKIRKKNVADLKEVLERRLGKENAKLIIDSVVAKKYRN